MKKENKGYKPDTIKKYISAMLAMIAYFVDLFKKEGSLKVAISSGNRKLGMVYNVSLAPIITCANCSGCKEFCYDLKSCLQYGNVMRARARNTALLRMDRDSYFAQIESIMTSKKKHRYFRWHVSGEIVDMDYLQRMIDIARRHPDWTYWTYTKHYMVVNRWIRDNGGNKNAIPSNLHIMFSEWKGMEIINPYGMPEFRVHFPGEKKPACYHCPGNCDVCKRTNRGCLAGETSYVDLH